MRSRPRHLLALALLLLAALRPTFGPPASAAPRAPAAPATSNAVFTAHPTPTFGGGQSYDVALGDLDGDGDLDALVANYGGLVEPETVWLNNGGGIFTPHPTTSSFGTGASFALALGDLDGDGDLDALVVNASVASKVWLNNGLGSFTAHPSTPNVGTLGSSVALGDLDGDNDLDAVVNDLSGSERVWLNNGLGSFTAHPSSPSFGGLNGYDLSLGDLDGDGDLDALVANYAGQAETVWLNNGAGIFTAHPTTPSFGAAPGPGGSVSQSTAALLGDLDGDGDLDALIANAGTQAETVWLNEPLPAGPALVYLPLLRNAGIFALGTITASAIPSRPVTQTGQLFHTTTITMPNPLPAGGKFYLSTQPAALTQTLVDDAVELLAGATRIFYRDYVVSGTGTFAIVEVPRTALAPYAGQPITVKLFDVHGDKLGAPALYLIWVP